MHLARMGITGNMVGRAPEAMAYGHRTWGPRIENVAFLFCDVFALSQLRSFDKDRDHHREKCNIPLVL